MLKERFWGAIERFAEDPFAKDLRTLKLTGNLSGCWAFSFMFLKGCTAALLIDIGTHEEIS